MNDAVHAIVCAHPWIVGGLAMLGPLFLLQVIVLHLGLWLADRTFHRDVAARIEQGSHHE